MGTLSKDPVQKRPRQSERRLNLRILPFLVAGLGFLYILTGYRGWLIFTIGTGGAWLLAFLWVHSLQRNLEIERKINLAWATVGESVPEEIRLSNRGWLPALWVEITDVSDTMDTPMRLVSDVAGHTHRTRHLNHLFKRRGVYTLGPTRLRCSDPFGIYTLTKLDQHASTILIMPPLLPSSQIKIPSGGIAGDERLRRGFMGRNINDIGLRNYIAGDSLKYIHWRASAHFDELIVRQLETAASRDWLIFVDLDEAVQAGAGDNSTLELCIVLAASLTMRGLRENRKVGLVMAGPGYVKLEPSTDPTQSWRILRLLANAQPGSHSLSELMQQGQSIRTATVILITPSSDPAWVGNAQRQQKWGSLTALLVDPTDFGSPVGQERVLAALKRGNVPYRQLPGKLLADAYATGQQNKRRQILAGEKAKLYSQHGRPAWQSVD
ncbi:MAG: hypothetical protein C3F13_18905 [Anaerolineales bacterium]|nr:MAG: hypothetical protein C3F13_18905 [Anaerolineales bacterium]